jgi:hypothetical protein
LSTNSSQIWPAFPLERFTAPRFFRARAGFQTPRISEITMTTKRLSRLLVATCVLGALSAPALAEDGTVRTTRDGQQTPFASEGGLGTTRIVNDCATRRCEGFASDGGLGTTRVNNDD